MTLQFGPIVASIAYYVARERFTRQRELMRMMGMSDASLMWSWVIMFVIMNLIIAFFSMIQFMIFMIKYSDWFLLMLMLWFFANALTVFGMSMAAFISSDKWSAFAALGIFFGASWSVLAVGEYPEKSEVLLLGLLPSNGFSFTASSYFQWEWWKVGLTWGNSFTDVRGNSFGQGLGWLFFDFWVWLGIYYYFDQIVPWHNVGVARKPWFCCLGSYWREFFGKPPMVGEAFEVDMKRQNSGTRPEFIENEDDEHLKRMVANNQCVIVDSLEKSFRDAVGTKIKAVDGLSLKMYQDECFCLLGHNGAGKTTTMMMITGCMPQSAGTIKVQGCDIPEQIRAIRSSMGFCPQHNVLWDELTVFEHLELFGALGGMQPQQIAARGDELLTAVALLDKKQARASALSGGMKRKLSCALAFLSEPYMVILDEPSSGMDPFARRGMWDTLKRWRSGHIICLTTHYMDEADALGDRIAIMANGKLACSGSSTFLKRTFGCGYVISFAKKSEGNELDGAILNLVRSVLGPVAEVMSAVGKELLLQVPFSSAEQFPQLFPVIDSQKDTLKIESYGTAVTNLEEVFLKVAKIQHGDMKVSQQLSGGLQKEVLIDAETVLPTPSFLMQFWALLLRRFYYGMRDKMSFMCNLMIPIFCLFLAIFLLSLSIVTSLPKLELTIDAWNPEIDGPRAPLSLGWSSGHMLAGEIETRWAQRAGLGPIYASSIQPEQYVPPPDANTAILAGYAAFASPGTLGMGMQQEAGFVKYYMENQKRQEASQYGAVFYPTDMSWCPKPPSNLPPGGWWPQPGPTIFQNYSAKHAAPILFNAHGEVAVSQATNGAVSKIKVSNHPFDKTDWEQARIVRVSGILASLMIMASYGFIPSGATYYIVLEKERDVYNQLIISGASQIAYWLSNFVFDIMWGYIPAIGAMIIFAAYDMTAFIEEPGLSASILLFFIYMPAMAGLAYLFSFVFSKAGNALIFSWIFNLSIGFLGTILLAILLEIEDTYDFGVIARWLFRFIPTFSLGYGFLFTSVQQTRAKAKGVGPLAGIGVGGTWCTPKDEVDGKYREDYYCRYMIGDEFLIMAICAFLYIFLTIFFDIVWGLPAFKKFFGATRKLVAPALDLSQEDEMVQAEKERVKAVDPLKQFVFVKDVHKVYQNGMHAVKGISFAASDGQVFGLLGVNGAGKTSTFKMLCGQVEQTSGEIMIQGISVATRAPEARRLIGYCPQFDALLASLTVDEHLFLYGRLKGLAGRQLAEAVSAQIKELDLEAYVKSRAGQLSGGNKRKLSVAMATIAEPPMVFLDEPSAGMDPVARRGMWSLIQNIAEKRKKSVVILTTHSMEEAEALCSRIAIQVDGQFRCLGTPQQIKSKYGLGLELNVRLAAPTQAELAESCTKLGGVPGTVASLQDAIPMMVNTFGQQVTEALQCRQGSPLVVLPGQLQPRSSTQLGVLAEWGLLQQRTSAFENFLLKEFGAETGGKPSAVVLEKTQNVIRYQILPDALMGRFSSLGTLFQLFKDNSKSLLVEDFQICQTSLEQVFNRFAATQMAQAAYGAAAPPAAPATAVPATASEQKPIVQAGAAAPEEQPEVPATNEVTPIALGRTWEESDSIPKEQPPPTVQSRD